MRRARPRHAALLGVVLLALATTAHGAAPDGRRLAVRDGRLVDQRGREVTLRGVNTRVEGVFDVTFDDGRLPLEAIPRFDAGDAERMAAFGFNLLRLPISWSALEPVRGTYDRAYLDRIAAVVRLCRAHGILVLLDFHQDAFSKEIGQDGAPRWLLDRLLGAGNYPYVGGPLEDLGARRLHPATIEAFRQFFRNTAGAVDDLAAAARVLARRFARERAVVGYEIMNEPLAAVLGADGEAALLDLHVRVTRAIRTVDRRHLVVFEPDTLRNFLNQAPLSGAPFPDRRALYAPHIYTGVFDGTDFSGGDVTLLAPSMERAAVEAAAWGAPLLIGEYGIDPGHPFADAWITAQLDLQDRLRAHSTFWLWEEISSGHWGLYEGESDAGGERVARTTALSRPYARAVPGRVLEHAFDAARDTLRLRFVPAGRAPVELFVPSRRYPGGFVLRCNGMAVSPRTRGAANPVRLRCDSRSGESMVELLPAP